LYGEYEAEGGGGGGGGSLVFETFDLMGVTNWPREL
jgi:hypothetical protein